MKSWRRRMAQALDIHVLRCRCRLCRQFQAFDRMNPNVYDYMVKLARLVKSRGLHKYAVEGIWQQLRWHYRFEVVRTPTEPEFKFCDHHRTRYARLIMALEDDLDGFFDTKRMKCEPRN